VKENRQEGEVMAGRNGGTGTGEAGKVGRPRTVDKSQRKLVLEEGKGKKRVTFSEEEERKEDIISIGREEWEDLKKEVRELRERWEEGEKRLKEVEERKIGWEERFKGIEVGCEDLGKGIGEIKEKIKEIETEIRREIRDKGDSRGSSERGFRNSSTRDSSRESSSRGSRVSERISEKNIVVLKRIIDERDRDMRKENIVIKGWEAKKINREVVEEFIEGKLGIKVRVKRCWKSGKVVVASLMEEEMKKEIIRSKKKLKGERIFIENDLTFEERKRQERIVRWAWEEKGKGKMIKVGLGKILFEGKWWKWEVIEKEWERRKVSEGVGRGERRDEGKEEGTSEGESGEEREAREENFE